jgi:hypothetical protein
MNKTTTISIIIIGLVIVGAFILSSSNNSNLVPDNKTNTNIGKDIVIDNLGNSTTTIPVENKSKTITVSNNVNVINGTQVVDLTAKGGYSPRQSVAKAGLPTIIRFITSNTFDCSASVRISSLNISKLLPQTGSTDIDIGTSTAGLFRGTCGMGMYPFEIDFQ